MRRLTPTTILSGPQHVAIVGAKQEPRRSRLRAIEVDVLARILELEIKGPLGTHTSDLGHVCPGEHDPCVYADLRSLWTGTSQPLSSLKHALDAEQHGPDTCPYCGIDVAYTFDHYLPQSSYPEFSVAAVNLFRCCERCNLLKSQHVPVGRTRVLHPARDPLDVQLLRCYIDDSREPPVPRFSIDPASAAAQGVVDECTFHFNRLRLGERLRSVAAPELSAFLLELATSELAPDVRAVQIARRRADAHRMIWGPNRWTALLFAAIADWLERGAPAAA